MQLRDGRTVTVRRLVPADRQAVHDLISRTSDANLYLRFFATGRRQGDQLVTQLCAPDSVSIAWVATDHDHLIGVADLEPGPDETAEIAFLVDDDEHEQGVATLLLMAAADEAPLHGLTQFTAVVLSVNAAMLGVFEDSGYPVHMVRRGSEVELWLDVTAPRRPLLPARCAGA